VAGIPFKPDLPPTVKTTTKRKLLDPKLLANSDSRKFIAMASGINLGGYGDAKESLDALFLLSMFLRG
jgi:hypothetical protein